MHGPMNVMRITFAFPSQQWLRERAMMLPYTYITYVVSLVKAALRFLDR